MGAIDKIYNRYAVRYYLYEKKRNMHAIIEIESDQICCLRAKRQRQQHRSEDGDRWSETMARSRAQKRSGKRK